jgi:transcriptional regulator with XRE-family HTH domain
MIRKEHRMSQPFVAHHLGVSRDQIERIESGTATVRFFVGWSFCRLTNTNPLWVVEGDPQSKHGFVDCANSSVPPESSLADVMRTYGKRYRVYRFLNQSAAFESGAVFSDQPSMLAADYIKLGPPDPPQFEVPKNLLGKLSIKHSLRSTMTWQELRSVLRSETETPTAKAALASFLGVSLAAVSQWRSGASAPTAEKVLRILDWLRSPAASLTKMKTPRPRRSATAANAKGKSVRREKPNSGRK